MLGFLNINKPSGVSSAQVVGQLKKKFHIAKIGHMGTLDPMASGVLPIAIGKATRLFDYFLEKQKTYIAEFEFGYQTDTLDAEGTVTQTSLTIPTKEQIQKVLHTLLGDVLQMPPQYSAKNVHGTRAYVLARQGKTVDLTPKKVHIDRLELLQQKTRSKFEFLIVCSSGTYIRSIGRDLAEKLNSCATMTALKRIQSGYFHIENAHTVEEIDDLSNCIINPMQVFSQYPVLQVSQDTVRAITQGKKVELEQADGKYWICYQDRVVGLAKIQQKKVKMKVYLWEEEKW